MCRTLKHLPTPGGRGCGCRPRPSFTAAAFGTPEGGERAHPWGEAPPDATRGNFGFQHWEPVPVGSYPTAVSAWGVHDLMGNGWEWTSTVFEGFPGFRPMASYPEYSADFFDGQHYVIKGASPVTATGLVRRQSAQLVPAPLSVCLCRVPLCGGLVDCNIVIGTSSEYHRAWPVNQRFIIAPHERRELQWRARSRMLPAEDVRRARLILRLAKGEPYSSLAKAFGCNRSYISRWKKRFEQDRLSGLYSRHAGKTPEETNAETRGSNSGVDTALLHGPEANR